MDEQKKEQVISAIYIAIYNGNYRCAQDIFDDVLIENINEKLDKVIELIEKYGCQQLTEKIRELKDEN